MMLPMAGLPAWTLLGMVAAIPAAGAMHRVFAHPQETARVVPGQALTLIAFLTASAGSGIGILVAP